MIALKFRFSVGMVPTQLKHSLPKNPGEKISPRPSTPVIPEGTLPNRRPDPNQFRFLGETSALTAPPT